MGTVTAGVITREFAQVDLAKEVYCGETSDGLLSDFHCVIANQDLEQFINKLDNTKLGNKMRKI
ncbi:hypothetical protein Glove_243g55 [Diversispora epigaea]|uniref:Uncharacterized protein n=1 Tax=Diversispora epigaea TaxID=1348612 RepID=A0A397IBS1_9GLOM|nr:hypothetical protein Glove_243g55 [Diversispora epigaea]